MKPVFVISCPIDTYSGYGARSRDLVKAVIDLDKYDVKIAPQRWGNTPWNFIEDHKEQWGFLKKYFLNSPQLNKQPEVWMQITVPNEFQPIGKFNIGVTAGIETTICDASWIQGLNRMNLNLVSSNHAKQVFMESKYEQRDQNTHQVVGIVELNKPVKVLMEGAHLDVYKHLNWEDMTNPIPELDSITEDFCYLVVGHWMQGDLGEDRKNIGLTVKSFYETFKNREKAPALILKTSSIGASYMDRSDILRRINIIRDSVKATTLPKVYLLHGEFSDTEMNIIYNHPKVKAMVSLTKGEGFGRPLLEFSLTKKPIIATGWSGHTDFLDPEYTNLLTGELKNVHPSAAIQSMILQESQWLSVDVQQVAATLMDVFTNYDKQLSKAKRQYHRSKSKFSYEAMATDLGYILDRYLPEFPKPLQLKLPQLKKIELPKLKKVEENEKG